MKNLKHLSIFLFSLLIFTAWKADSKLTQEGAEKAIKEFIKRNNSATPAPKINITEILALNPVTILSETKMSCQIKAKGTVENSGLDSVPIVCPYLETYITMEFFFEKKADNKWVLKGVYKFASKVKVSNEYMQQFLKQNKDLDWAVE